MNGRPVCYGVRRLNPFQGVIQVVELGDARALSPDGVHWEVQILCAQPEHSWRSSNQGEPVMRYLRFGTWSRAAGLRRVPLSPILDMDLLFRASAALTEALRDCLDALPFALDDRHELWLLDRDGEPFALLASSTSASFGARPRPEPWAASARSDHGFQSPRLLERGVPAHKGHDPRHHATLLERLVRDTAGRPVRARWLEREARGAAPATDPDRTPGARSSRRLAAASCPPLLLREEWPEPSDRDLVQDYLHWCAPFLLTLPDLDDVHRDRLEHAAKARAMEVDALYRLYPKILNPGLVKSLCVEARIRRSNARAKLAGSASFGR